MGKYLGFILCVIAGLGVMVLSLIDENLYCFSDVCRMQTRIRFTNMVVSEDIIPLSEIRSLSCSEKFQPDRRGKKAYYALELVKTDGTEYILGNYKKYNICKNNYKIINNYFKGKTISVIHDSGTNGVTNTMGLIFSFLLFYIAYMVITSKFEPEDTEDLEDDLNDDIKS